MGVLGVLVLKDLKLAIDDPKDDLHLSLGASEIRVVNQGATTHLAGKVRNLAGDPTPVDLIADLDLNRRNGIFYAGGHDIDLARFAAAAPVRRRRARDRPRRCADLDRRAGRARRGRAHARRSPRCDVRRARSDRARRRHVGRAAHAFRSHRVRRALAARRRRLDGRRRRSRRDAGRHVAAAGGAHGRTSRRRRHRALSRADDERLAGADRQPGPQKDKAFEIATMLLAIGATAGVLIFYAL